ncbi:MAG: transcriptional regulator NrdR [Chloroflexi bacterium]|nr:transcriptional regulator NrdR [Chloroflexota bacterium]
MRCPHCGSQQSRVVETREAEDAVRRRRECSACKLRFTTYERPQFPRLVVRAASGTQRNFTRAWLAAALRTSGVDLPDAALLNVVAAIEAQLRATGQRVVHTGDVAAVALREVRQSAGLAGHRHDPSAERVTIALDATLAPRRRVPSQLPLPLESEF